MYTNVMTTTDNVLLIILTSLLSILILIGIIILIAVLNLTFTLRRVVGKAENVVNSVEATTEVFSEAKGRLAIIKLINNLVKLAQKKR